MTFSPADMSVLKKRIIDLFAASPALKAKDIARQLGVETKEVNSFLYSNKGKLLEKDEAHVWRLRSNQTGVASGVNDSQSTEGDPNAPNCPK